MKSIPLMSIRGIVVGLALVGCGGADPDIAAIGLDGRGRLWTLPSLPPNVPPLVEVHDGNGAFLGAFTLDRRPVQMAVRGEWLALVFEDEVGLATVRVLRIEEG